MKVWREIFLEIALRAIRRTHFEFGIWELGQKELSIQNFVNLNQGHGIYYAPEETVRDSISQEIILSGIWKQHPIEGEPRSYWIDREIRIPFNLKDAADFIHYSELFSEKDEGNRYYDIDIVFKRIETEARDGQITLPTLIEAKRFELVNIDGQTREFKIGGPQYSQIDHDIFKLKLLKHVFKGKDLVLKEQKFQNFRTYILVWGLGKKDFNLEKDFLTHLKGNEYISSDERAIKYLPIRWNDKQEIESYLWIGLFQIE